MSQGRSDTPSLLERLRANTVAGKDREELLIEYGKLLGIGAPKPLVDAILRWNDLMAEAVVELERLAASETVPRIHPTPEMMEAGIQTVLRTEGEKADERARRIYRAMVNAAPPTETAARNDDDFHAGTLAALDVVYLHDQPVIAREIVNATDHKRLLEHAIREEYMNLPKLKATIKELAR